MKLWVASSLSWWVKSSVHRISDEMLEFWPKDGQESFDKPPLPHAVWRGLTVATPTSWEKNGKTKPRLTISRSALAVAALAARCAAMGTAAKL